VSLRLPWLGQDPASGFPPAERALVRPNGLLAAGGDLSTPRLLDAYRHGIFPWYSEGEPVLWWTPDPRCVFGTDRVHLSRRFLRALRKSDWVVRADQAFERVVAACAAPREDGGGTWITADMTRAYVDLHRAGHAHSIEVLDAKGDLVGGLYGVSIGRMMFAESMFSAAPGGSKVALIALARDLAARGFPLIDAQMPNPHLHTLGALEMPRSAFLARVHDLVRLPEPVGSWEARFGARAACSLARESGA